MHERPHRKEVKTLKKLDLEAIYLSRGKEGGEKALRGKHDLSERETGCRSPDGGVSGDSV